jgi:hypothetical protein
VEDPIDGTNEEQEQQRDERDGDDEAPAANSAAATRRGIPALYETKQPGTEWLSFSLVSVNKMQLSKN